MLRAGAPIRSWPSCGWSSPGGGGRSGASACVHLVRFAGGGGAWALDNADATRRVADAGHGRVDRRGRGRRRARRPAARRARVDEDGARHRGRVAGRRDGDPGRGRRDGDAGRPARASSKRAKARPATRRRSRAAVDLDHVRADLAEVVERHDDRARPPPRPTPSRAGARPGSGPRARTSPTSSTTAASSSTRRSSSPRSAGAARSRS